MEEEVSEEELDDFKEYCTYCKKHYHTYETCKEKNKCKICKELHSIY